MITYFAAGLVLGIVVGAGVTITIFLFIRRQADQKMRETFTALAADALDANSRRLLETLDGSSKRLTDATVSQLDGKKALIDQSVAAVNDRLDSVRLFLQRLEAERKQDLGALGAAVSSLTTTAGKIHEMLASTQRRGAWGERMAEDVLRLVGMQEIVNYTKQSGEQAEGGSRPDFTFFLPNKLKVNMDVKFPLERYKAYMDAADDAARTAQLQQLVTAVRNHVRDVAKRGYIDPKAPTVPYVIVFIPSEQIFGLVLSANPDLMDEALASKVVLASPFTLYAMLAVVRQAAENANIMKTADEVISLLSAFNKQWQKFSEELDRLGQRIQQASDQYEAVRTTRANMLQKPLDKIEDLRQARGLPEE